MRPCACALLRPVAPQKLPKKTMDTMTTCLAAPPSGGAGADAAETSAEQRAKDEEDIENMAAELEKLGV